LFTEHANTIYGIPVFFLKQEYPDDIKYGVMQNINPYAVIIVGAGPAGISTALHLAMRSPELIPRTLILEKAQHPRHKLCGGGLLPDAEVILRQLGLDVSEIPHVDVDWARFDFDGKGMKMRAEKNGRYAFRTIRRHEFDAWLAGKARERGFRLQENTAVKSIAVDEQGVTVSTDQGDFHAALVVGADGSKSVIRRAIIPREDTHVARLLEIVSEPKPEKSFHIQSDSYFDFIVIPQGIQGYVWDFPAVEKGKPVRMRGIYDANALSFKAQVPLRFALDEELGRHGLQLADYKLDGHPLRWFDAKSAFSSNRVILVGDAAGADALFGEGISIALGYGSLAANAIREAFARRDFSFHDYRQAVLHSELGKSLRLRTWMARFYYRFRSARFQAFVWRKMGWLVEWAMQAIFIGWARRQERKMQRAPVGQL
jgi:menaquinone-9 beta-reductase